MSESRGSKEIAGSPSTEASAPCFFYWPCGHRADTGHPTTLANPAYPEASRSSSLRRTSPSWIGSKSTRHNHCAEVLARISHAVFARSGRLGDGFEGRGGPWRQGRERSRDFFWAAGAANDRSLWSWDDAAVVPRCGGACQAGEPRALAAARRTAAQPQTSAAGQLDAIAILMRRTLTRTSAPILSSLRRMVPQLALANGV